MLPDYATVLIALGSALGGGALGGIGGAWLQIRHERGEKIRDRMIAAADDLATKLAQAAMGAGDAVRVATEAQAGGTESPDALIAEARRLLDEALAASARVDLLFGLGSPTVVAGNTTLSALEQVLAHLKPGERDSNEAQGFANEAGKFLAAFSAAAGEINRANKT